MFLIRPSRRQRLITLFTHRSVSSRLLRISNVNFNYTNRKLFFSFSLRVDDFTWLDEWWKKHQRTNITQRDTFWLFIRRSTTTQLQRQTPSPIFDLIIIVVAIHSSSTAKDMKKNNDMIVSSVCKYLAAKMSDTLSMVSQQSPIGWRPPPVTPFILLSSCWWWDTRRVSPVIARTWMNSCFIVTINRNQNITTTTLKLTKMTLMSHLFHWMQHSKMFCLPPLFCFVYT